MMGQLGLTQLNSNAVCDYIYKTSLLSILSVLVIHFYLHMQVFIMEVIIHYNYS